MCCQQTYLKIWLKKFLKEEGNDKRKTLGTLGRKKAHIALDNFFKKGRIIEFIVKEEGEEREEGMEALFFIEEC